MQRLLGAACLWLLSTACPLTEPAQKDGAINSDDAGEVGDNLGELPEPPQQAGIVYAGHYLSTELRAFRLDADHAYEALSFDTGVKTHDVAVDAYNDLLCAVSYDDNKARLYALHRPANPQETLQEPTLVAEMSHPDIALYTRFDAFSHRLYVVTSTPDTGAAMTEFLFYVYDIADSSQPRLLADAPYRIPATSSVDVDDVRKLLFVVSLVDDRLYVYDIGDDTLVALDGDPIDLKLLYPESNDFAFQVHDLLADPYGHRVLAARAQGNVSELVALSYPADIPRRGAHYRHFASTQDFEQIIDPFDVSLPVSQRPLYMDAWQPLADPRTGAVFLSVSAYNGGSWSPLELALDSSMNLAASCQDHEGLGCFLRVYSSAGQALDYPRTGAGACLDHTHRVLAVASAQRDQPGRIHFFNYDDILDMTAWLPDGAGNFTVGNVPVSLACH